MADDNGPKVWSKEVEAYVCTMVNELLITSPLQKVSLGEQGCELAEGELSDLFATTSERRKDIFGQIHKIRRVKLLDQPEEMLAGCKETLDVLMADHKRVPKTDDRAEQIGLEEFKQVLQEPSCEFKQLLKQKDPGGETGSGGGGCLGSQQQASELSKDGGLISMSEWASYVSRKSGAELELEHLACQVQLLIHQLTTCRQNLLKAEREVDMLHDENCEFRSLIQDMLAAFSGS